MHIDASIFCKYTVDCQNKSAIINNETEGHAKHKKTKQNKTNKQKQTKNKKYTYPDYILYSVTHDNNQIYWL